MTLHLEKKKKRCGRGLFTHTIISFAATLSVFFTAVCFSDELSFYAIEGMKLSVRVIIPSVFPFLLLTDFIIPYINFNTLTPMKRIFEKCFNISSSALSVFIFGIMCGFPVGPRLALTLYKNGSISRDECERLFAFSNNASVGYVVSAVGYFMRGSLCEGIILYLSMLFSALSVGALLGINKNKSNYVSYPSIQNYSFVDSVKNATAVCLTIAGFVTAFSIICGIIRSFIKNESLIVLLLPLLEIGNAAVYLSKIQDTAPNLTLALTSFAISFSGLCVYAQTKSIIDSKNEISTKKYLPAKLLQGVIAFLFTLVVSLILQ